MRHYNKSDGCSRKKDSVLETKGQINVIVATDYRGGTGKGGSHSKNRVKRKAAEERCIAGVMEKPGRFIRGDELAVCKLDTNEAATHLEALYQATEAGCQEICSYSEV